MLFTLSIVTPVEELDLQLDHLLHEGTGFERNNLVFGKGVFLQHCLRGKHFMDVI